MPTFRTRLLIADHNIDQILEVEAENEYRAKQKFEIYSECLLALKDSDVRVVEDR